MFEARSAYDATFGYNLERLADLPEETVLVQRNDRVPQHLCPQLEERGYAYETVRTKGTVLTAVWR